MKRLLPLLLLFYLLLPLLCFPSLSAPAEEEAMRGIWVSSVFNIDFPSRAGLDQQAQKQELNQIVQNAKSAGLNAIFFQVRPSCDALYPSKLFPWSSFLTGEQGKENDGGFDPLAYLIEIAHRENIQVHAWLNPLRITTGSADKPRLDVNVLAENNPARLHPDWTVAHKNGMLYFDPGLPEVRKLIADGAAEIAQNYAVDGVHFDDYFYPSPADGVDFADEASYARYGNGLSLADWRRQNIDQLIGEVHTAVKKARPSAVFGVSPSGVWADAGRMDGGSETVGSLSSYLDHYADTKGWVEKGLIDYIAPQIYWHIGYERSDFEKLLSWWSNVCRDTGVKLYAGHAVYKVGDPNQADPWQQPGEIAKQLALVASDAGCAGSIFYGYDAFCENRLGVRDSIAAFYGASAGSEPLTDLPNPGTFYPMPDRSSSGIVLSSPQSGFSTTAAHVSILGACAPNESLFCNGQEVQKTANGYFSAYVPLSLGQNHFVFTQPNGDQKGITIVRTRAKTQSSFWALPDFVPGSFSPAVSVTKESGSKLLFACKAPSRAKVTVQVGSYTIPLVRDPDAPSGPACTAAAFTGEFLFPPTDEAVEFIGVPTFILTLDGQRVTHTLETTVTVQDPGYHKTGTLTEDVLAKTELTLESKRDFPLIAGVSDRIVGEWGDYYQLLSGFYIPKDKTAVSDDAKQGRYISAIKVSSSEKQVFFSFSMPETAPYSVEVMSDRVVVTFYGVKGRGLFRLPDNPLFDRLTYQKIGPKTARYTLHRKPETSYLGYLMQKSEKGLLLSFRLPAKAQAPNSLQGLTIVLDPGHGEDPGAQGPLGGFGPAEKDINLAVALYTRDYLQGLGATVVLTRESDARVSLQERIALTKAQNPDLFVSIHGNSMPESADYTKSRGLLTMYSLQNSEQTARSIHQALNAQLGRADLGLSCSPLYVCNINCCPALLIETGFLSNPSEYEDLSDPAWQKGFAKALALSILQSFSAQEKP